MRRVQEQELSALLDGELDIERADEVRARIKSDPALRREYELLARLDARLSRAAADATFVPDVTLPVHAPRKISFKEWTTGIAVVLALITVRFLPKLIDLQILGVAVQLAACAGIAFLVMRLANETEPGAQLARHS